jgi:hypothetical protein
MDKKYSDKNKTSPDILVCPNCGYIEDFPTIPEVTDEV